MINDKQQAQAEVKVKNRRRRKVKVTLLFLLILVFCCFITSGVSAFLWYGGHLQSSLCTTVESNSAIANRLNCANFAPDVRQEGEGEFKINVIDEDRQISDLEQMIVSVVENSTESVVGIGLEGDEFTADRIIGTGFIVTENGLIVTNQHVVSTGAADNYFVVIGGESEQIAVTEIFRDEVNDIAIVRIDKTGLNPLPLGDSNQLQVGQTAIAIGNPLGELTGTITTGTISGVHRDVEVGSGVINLSSQSYSDVIQTDAAINPGNSGGPLLNTKGEVIGVNFATIQGADNLSFALPINRVKNRIDEINEFGNFRIPFLGIEYRRRVVFFENEALIGTTVLGVVKNGPADVAGLQVGDIIVQYNETSLEDSTLLELIQESEIGEEIELTILRGENSRSITVKIGDRSDYQ